MPNTPIPLTRRGAFLFLISAIYFIIGGAYADPHTSTTAPPEAYLAALHLVHSIRFWGAVWAAVGLVGMITAFVPPWGTLLGYSALAGWSFGWGVLTFSSTLFYGSERGWTTGLVWLTFGMALLIVSGMNRHEVPPK